MVLAPYTDDRLATSAAVMWALSSGRPVIGSRIPAFSELNLGEQRMLLVTPGAPGELARVVIELRENEELMAELVANASLFCAQTGWDKVAQRHLEVYQAAQRSSRGRR